MCFRQFVQNTLFPPAAAHSVSSDEMMCFVHRNGFYATTKSCHRCSFSLAQRMDQTKRTLNVLYFHLVVVFRFRVDFEMCLFADNACVDADS